MLIDQIRALEAFIPTAQGQDRKAAEEDWCWLSWEFLQIMETYEQQTGNK